MESLQKIIQNTFENKNNINFRNLDINISNAINQVIDMLNQGVLRVSEKIQGQWVTHQWIKQAILLYFYVQQNTVIKSHDMKYYDKIKLKYSKYQEQHFIKDAIRIVPPASIRYGSFIGKNTILMPSFINIGAYIDTGTMIDTWATVGSCAQIGKNVHLSGGVGIGGVLEPLQNNPTIVEDNCFIGARSEIVEGIIIESGSVISMGVYIGRSTKIYDRNSKTVSYGKIPKGSVVVPGSLPSKNRDHNLYCAIIVKKVDEKTLSKIKINEILRNID
ncbi:2,3,4,5-tetrahydropyridine-2,6-dicarboxylate N-succinyltransferase [Buchnera aphidicola]|uniref:2,3,4,5-tetrahydropyridine-2,6-dicarboxylate N-succinyltransferase n=1 Tax=Buchnera aphidicola subsp. Melaphis rhois TaxID=118103 RepID=A0A4D6YB64_BUCMH|nr:2,3,4,5-tetrahydropyridine-2,6-dicarboxylate N-succinyltransferase [Buchnera aphidicola]QCI23244.1 2,3,4,5-tetrahydropyridine-2,6-dicarboxylate N-succinyltransferase [Buchnera aphidicola (Melaphis rhois)]